MLSKEVRDYLAFRKKKAVLDYARECGSAAKSYRLFGVPGSRFYRWKKTFEEEGDAGLVRKKPVAVTVRGTPCPGNLSLLPSSIRNDGRRSG